MKFTPAQFLYLIERLATPVDFVTLSVIVVDGDDSKY